MQNLSYDVKVDHGLYENEHVGGTYFHMDGFARKLVLTQRQKATRKWPIQLCFPPENIHWLSFKIFRPSDRLTGRIFSHKQMNANSDQRLTSLLNSLC